MAGHDPSDARGEFEYLFEPIAGDTTTESPVREPAASVPSVERRRRSVWLLAAASVVGVAIGAVLMWPDPVEAAPAPEVPSNRPSSQPVSTTPPTEATVPPTPQTPTATPTSIVAPSPSAAPETTAAVPPPSPTPPQSRQVPSPSLRTPISVSPTPRQPFPNESPPSAGDAPPGGLLGGGGIL